MSYPYYAPPPPGDLSEEEEDEPSPKSAKKKPGKVVVIILIGLVVLSLAVAALWLFQIQKFEVNLEYESYVEQTSVSSIELAQGDMVVAQLDINRFKQFLELKVTGNETKLEENPSGITKEFLQPVRSSWLLKVDPSIFETNSASTSVTVTSKYFSDFGNKSQSFDVDIKLAPVQVEATFSSDQQGFLDPDADPDPTLILLDPNVQSNTPGTIWTLTTTPTTIPSDAKWSIIEEPSKLDVSDQNGDIGLKLKDDAVLEAGETLDVQFKLELNTYTIYTSPVYTLQINAPTLEITPDTLTVVDANQLYRVKALDVVQGNFGQGVLTVTMSDLASITIPDAFTAVDWTVSADAPGQLQISPAIDRKSADLQILSDGITFLDTVSLTNIVITPTPTASTLPIQIDIEPIQYTFEPASHLTVVSSSVYEINSTDPIPKGRQVGFLVLDSDLTATAVTYTLSDNVNFEISQAVSAAGTTRIELSLTGTGIINPGTYQISLSVSLNNQVMFDNASDPVQIISIYAGSTFTPATSLTSTGTDQYDLSLVESIVDQRKVGTFVVQADLSGYTFQVNNLVTQFIVTSTVVQEDVTELAVTINTSFNLSNSSLSGNKNIQVNAIQSSTVWSSLSIPIDFKYPAVVLTRQPFVDSSFRFLPMNVSSTARLLGDFIATGENVNIPEFTWTKSSADFELQTSGQSTAGLSLTAAKASDINANLTIASYPVTVKLLETANSAQILYSRTITFESYIPNFGITLLKGNAQTWTSNPYDYSISDRALSPFPADIFRYSIAVENTNLELDLNGGGKFAMTPTYFSNGTTRSEVRIPNNFDATYNFRVSARYVPTNQIIKLGPTVSYEVFSE